MNNNLLHVNLNREGHVNRRQLLRLSGAGFAGLAASDILGTLGVNAAEMKRQGRACIMLFMDGAPSQMDTWDPKPGTDNGGPTEAIDTAVSGIQISQFFPRIAKQMRDISIIRTIAGKEAAHERGKYHLRTGRRLTGAKDHPHIGSVVAHQNGDPDTDIPNFISIGGNTQSAGFLGVRYAPFTVNNAGQMPAFTKSLTGEPKLRRRMELLKAQNETLADLGAPEIAQERNELYDKAARLMTSERLKAFTLNGEKDQTKKMYGDHAFGKGCLVARRLVESGVPFVEVRQGGWDMHQELWTKIPKTGGYVDQGLSALVQDLKSRGLLDSTLIVLLGEFGRTPKINNREPTVGRDHWARNFSCLMAGGGTKGGQVIGKTSDDGMEIEDRPVEVDDLFQTMCKSLHVDADEELWTPSNRPLRIVDAGTPVEELFG